MYGDNWTKVALFICERIIIARESVQIFWKHLQLANAFSVCWCFSMTSDPYGIHLRINEIMSIMKLYIGKFMIQDLKHLKYPFKRLFSFIKIAIQTLDNDICRFSNEENIFA